MEYIAVIGYFLLFCLLIRQVKWFHKHGLSKQTLYALFLVKAIVGIAYGQVDLVLYYGRDTLAYFEGGKVLFSTLKQDPLMYLRLVFGPNGGFVAPEIFKYAYESGFWEQNGSYFMLRFHALLHSISFGTYKVHALFMAFITLLASINYYRVLKGLNLMPERLLLMLVFFTPSILYWTTGMHKDGFIYFSLSLCLSGLFCLQKKEYKRAIMKLIISLFLLYLVRDYLLGVVLLPLVACVWSILKPGRVYLKYTIVLLGLGILGLLADYAIDSINILEILSNKQAAFSSGQGGSDFTLPQIGNNWLSLLQISPVAMKNVLTRPHIWSCTNILQYLAAFELMAFFVFVLYMLIKRGIRVNKNPILLFAFFYALGNLYMIGVLVSNEGTLVRYRAVGLFFLIITLLSFVKWKVEELSVNQQP